MCQRYAADFAVPHIRCLSIPNGQRHDRCEVVERLVRAAILHVMAFEFIEPYEVVARELRSKELQGERQLAESDWRFADRA